MDYVILMCCLFGGMGVFLVGMTLMSDSMSSLARGKLRTVLNKTASNRLVGVGIGAGVTAVIQSSAATTVMVVGLVNAGAMTLLQATSIIMGANIGTTVTAQIAALGDLPISQFLYLPAAVGIFMTMFSKNEKIKVIGNFLAGVGLIFVGLAFMSDAMKDEKINKIISDVLSSPSLTNPIILLVIGALATALIQSSSAVTSIVIALAMSEVVIGGNGDGVFFVIIGSNIGTCITALLSSVGANTNARRAAFIHLLFNCFGAVVFTAFLLLWSLSGTTFSEVVLQTLFPDLLATQIAMFHTLFNIVCTCLFLPFTKQFVWIAEKLVPSKEESEKSGVRGDLLVAPDERLLRNTSVALGYFYQKTGKVFDYAMESLDLAVNAFLNRDEAAKSKILAINEEILQINRLDVDYLVKLSYGSPSVDDEKTISKLHYVLNDIVRIGELADNVTKYTSHYVNDNLEFSEEFLTMIKDMFGKITRLQKLAHDAFINKDRDLLKQVDGLEDEIDKDRRNLADSHIVRLKEGKCQPQNSNVFINLVGNLERAADHITYIAHSID